MSTDLKYLNHLNEHAIHISYIDLVHLLPTNTVIRTKSKE